MRILLALQLAAAPLLTIAICNMASAVSLANPSFENDTVATNGFTNDNPQGWTVSETSIGGVGLLDGTAGVPGPTEGDQHLFINAEGGDVATAWQTPLNTLSANTLYTLTFDVANRDRGNDGAGTEEAGDVTTTVAAFFTLGSDDDDLTQAVGTPFLLTLSAIANGTYLSDQIATFSTVGLANLNQSLNLVLYHTTTGATLSQSNWDNIRLSETAIPLVVVPEPGTLLLTALGAAMCACGAYRRRRQM